MSSTSSPSSPSPPLRTPTQRAIFLFFLEFAAFFIITFNIRAVAQLDYLMTFATDLIIAVIGFTTVKQIVEAKTRLEQAAYAIGGALGAQAALWISSRYFPS